MIPRQTTEEPRTNLPSSVDPSVPGYFLSIYLGNLCVHLGSHTTEKSSSYARKYPFGELLWTSLLLLLCGAPLLGSDLPSSA